MYVDFPSECLDLNMILGANGNNYDRSWNIQVMQYEMGFVNLAPEGCTQYYYDKEDADGILRSYNWQGGIHLADQKQVVCIRREEDKSQICYSAVEAQTDIDFSGKANAAGMEASCGGYTKDGKGTFVDALMIPSLDNGYSNVCGHKGFSDAAGIAVSVCSKYYT